VIVVGLVCVLVFKKDPGGKHFVQEGIGDEPEVAGMCFSEN